MAYLAGVCVCANRSLSNTQEGKKVPHGVWLLMLLRGWALDRLFQAALQPIPRALEGGTMAVCP